MLKILAIFCTLIVFTGCASVRAPSGGEEDKTPPVIEESFPSNGMTNVPLGSSFVLGFQQNIDRSSLMQSLTITPYMSGTVMYKWNGYDEVRITPPEQLRANTTYVLTLAKELRTLRGGKLESPLQIIFSTGPHIDSGIVRGTVIPKLFTQTIPGNTYIFAYDLTRHSPDTLDMTHTRPDYLTQPDASGRYELRALAIGHTYRIAAITDEFVNRLYDHTSDDFGTPLSDIILDSVMKQVSPIVMMPKVDTLKPQLQEVDVRDVHQLRAVFSEMIDSASIPTTAFDLSSEMDGRTIAIEQIYRDNPDKRPNIYTLVTRSKILPSTKYVLQVHPNTVRDLNGNVVNDSFRTIRFITSDKIIDTLPAVSIISHSIADSAKDVPLPLQAVIRFNGAVTYSDSAFQLTDTLERSYPIHIRQSDGNLLFVSSDSLTAGSVYRLLIHNGRIYSTAENKPLKDTTIIIRFFTESGDDYGSLSGSVLIDSLMHGTKIIIDAEETSTKKHYQTSIDASNKYSFSSLPRGRYLVRAWLTTSENGKYQGGSIKPFLFALPLSRYDAEIDIRPRWKVDNVDIELK